MEEGGDVWGAGVEDEIDDRTGPGSFHQLIMSTERAPKKRKTRSGCSGIELISAFHVLQKFRDKIQTQGVVEPDDSNLESVELEMEIDKDALAQLDGHLEWMDSKIKSTKKVRPCYLLDIGDFTSTPEPPVLSCQLNARERHSDYRGSTTFSQI
jgi:hypothetical protein